MNRWMVAGISGLALVLSAGPAAAQLVGLPVYFSPKGGTGITLAGDFGRVSSQKFDGVSSPVHPTTIGGRATLGLPMVTVGVGIAMFDPKTNTLDNEIQYAGSAAFKVFGGPLVPLAISIQAGAGVLSQGTGAAANKLVNVPIGIGAALNIPTPGASLEPWIAGRVHIRSISSSGASTMQTGIGLSGGLSMGLPIGLGAHVAVDWSRFGAKTGGALPVDEHSLLTVGVGIHYMISIPGLGGIPIVPGV